MPNPRAALLPLLLLLCALPAAAAPFDRSVRFAGGVGLSTAVMDGRGSNTPEGRGGYLAAEYVLHAAHWFTPRAYGGAIVTWPDRSSCGPEVAPCDVSSGAAFFGGKAHIMVPIPYVGPFFEIGVGATVGTISTRVGTLYDKDHTGVTYHIPFAIGLALGRNHDIELSFSYLLYPQFEHVDGAIALGFTLPLQ